MTQTAAELAHHVERIENGDADPTVAFRAAVLAFDLWCEVIAAAQRPELDNIAVLGRFHWQRFLASRDRRTDGWLATHCYDAVAPEGRWPVPDAVRRQLRRTAGTDRTDRMGSAARRMLRSEQHEHNVAAIDLAARLLVVALSVTPVDDVRFADYLGDLSNAMITRHERLLVDADLDLAITLGVRTVDVALPHDRELDRYVSNTVFAMRARFAIHRDVADLDRAVQLIERRLDLLTRRAAGALAELPLLLMLRYEAGNDPADLDAAIMHGRRALPVIAGHRNHPALAGNLASALFARFSLRSSDDDLDLAVRFVGLAPVEDPAPAPVRLQLSDALLRRFAVSDRIPDLHAACRLAREALAATPPDAPEFADGLIQLSTALATRFQHLGRPDDLTEAHEVGTRAVAWASGPSLAIALINQCDVLRMSFGRSQDPGELDEAVDLARRAVDLTPARDEVRSHTLRMLGQMLHIRAWSRGAPTDLDAAVEALRQALQIGDLAAAERATCASHLSQVLITRYEQTGGVTDLDAAIDVIAAAIPGADGPSRLAEMQHLMSIVLRMKFEDQGDPSALDGAVEAARQAVEHTAATDIDLPKRLSVLSLALTRQAELSPTEARFDAAVDAARRAVDRAAPNELDRFSWLSNLGAVHLARYRHLTDESDLDAAVAAFRAALAAAPPTHPHGIQLHTNLGTALRLRSRRDGSVEDLTEAARMFRITASSPIVPAVVRIQAAEGAAAAMIEAAGPAAAYADLRLLIETLPGVIWRGITDAEKRRLLRRTAASAAADAAAAGLADDDRDGAVELLEQGRAVLWSQRLDTRTDVTRLEAVDPDLAARIARCRAQLDAPASLAAPG